MTYRSLLAYLDDSPQCSARTAIAIRLARSLDCHLVGLAPTGLIDVPSSAEAAVALAEYAALAWDSLREQAERATQRFRDQCATAGMKSFEAVVDPSDKAPSLVRHAHCSDLIVLTQADPDAPGAGSALGLVEQVVLNSARPTLIIPYAGQFDEVGSNVMVAWNDSRESARALSDALPLLVRARTVQVVRWNEGSDDDAKALRRRLDALHQWLIWHGVSPELRIETTDETTDGDVAQAMLSHAADQNADLIVMGAYGHSRWVERVMGGATRGLLASMTVPVLMSH